MYFVGPVVMDSCMAVRLYGLTFEPVAVAIKDSTVQSVWIERLLGDVDL